MRSRGRSYKKWRKSENEQPSYCFAGFWTCRRCYLRPLGHYFGASWRHDSPSWRHVGLCWAILSHLGAISRHLGNQDGDHDCQDVPTWSAMWSPKADMRGGGDSEGVPSPLHGPLPLTLPEDMKHTWTLPKSWRFPECIGQPRIELSFIRKESNKEARQCLA